MRMKTGSHLLPLPVGTKLPHYKMEMGKKRISCFTTVPDELTLFNRIANFYHNTIKTQVPVTCPAAVGMLNNDHVAIRPVLFIPSAFIAILLYPYHDAVSCSNDGGAPFHFKIKRSPVLMRIAAEVTLHQQMTAAAFIRQVVNITGIFLYFSFLQRFDERTLRVFTYRTGNKKCKQQHRKYVQTISHLPANINSAGICLLPVIQSIAGTVPGHF